MKNTLLISTLCAASLAFSGVTAWAQESPVDTVAAAADSAVVTKADAKKTADASKQTNKLRNPDDVICKKSVKTSTRLRRSKICKTRAKWDEERVATAKQLNDIRSQTRVDQYD